MNNSQKGFIAPLLIGIVLVMIVGEGIYFYVQNKNFQNTLAQQKTFLQNTVIATTTVERVATSSAIIATSTSQKPISSKIMSQPAPIAPVSQPKIVSTTTLLKNQIPSVVSVIATSTANIAGYPMGVLVLKYFPTTTVNGQEMIDISVTGDWGDSYTSTRQKTIDITNNLIASLEKATTYLGYKNSSAEPSLDYSVVKTVEYKEAVPTIAGSYHGRLRYPDYNGILTSNTICDYVDNQNVKEVWIFAYQGPTESDGSPYLNIDESKMSGPYGDISNSYRYNDMPVCNHTYRVYTFNYQRGTAEAFNSWGHQIEAEMGYMNQKLFNIFEGPEGFSSHPQVTNETGRCGSVHNPPNSRADYDYANTIPQASDCLDWTPDGLGATTQISCALWGCTDVSDTNNSQLNYLIWLWQNLPGMNNTKTYQGNKLRNFWDVHADFDTAAKNPTLFQ